MTAWYAAAVLTLCCARAVAEPLMPCVTPQDGYLFALDARLDAGTHGRVVGALTAIPPWAAEWGVRILQNDLAFTVRVTTLKRVLGNQKVTAWMKTPARVEEFALSATLAGRIERALGRELERMRLEDQLSLLDNTTYRLSADGRCGEVALQSDESVPYEIVRIFIELKCLLTLPERKRRESYEQIDRLLDRIEAATT